MTRDEFMQRLKTELRGFSSAEVGRMLEYYDELFSDSLEAGKTEEEITASLETPEAIAQRMRVDLAFLRAEQEPSAKSMNTVLIILLGVFALPIGLPLAIAVVAVLFSVAMVAISLLVTGVALVAALGVSGLAILVVGVYAVVSGGPLVGFAMVGAGLFCIGLTLLTAIGSFALTRLLMKQTARLFRKIYMSATSRKKEAKV